MEENNEDLVFLGEIVNTQGRKGEVKVVPYIPQSIFVRKNRTNVVESIRDVYLVSRDGEKREARILDMREHKGFIILKFAGYDSIAQANQLKKYKVACKRIRLASGVYYVQDLMGMEVFAMDESGLKKLGRIVDIFGTGANDVYVIKKDNREILFPALRKLVRKVDINKKIMVVHLPEGL